MTRESIATPDDGLTHGTPAAYRGRGCRCDACKAAHNERMTEYRGILAARLKKDKNVTHGKRSTYINWGCRCDLCRQANSDYCAAYEADRKASVG